MRSSTQRSFSALALALVLGQAIAAPNHPGSSCSAQSPATMVPLVELYTSEGCSSCPPADRWLSRLKENPAVVALAFHVDYWDKLGWKDRFASPAYSRRQAQQQAFNGARFSYTPQVVLNGRDHPHWNATAIPASSSARSPATVTLTLSRSSDEIIATIHPDTGAPTRLAAYWAVTEDGHFTVVQSGENRGENLRHDSVVRELVEVPEWEVRRGTSRTLGFRPASAERTGHPRHINFVVVDAVTGKPLQAVRLDC